MGTSDFAGIILEDLIKSHHELLAVVTQPDHKDKKSKIISPVKETAQKNKLKILQPQRLDDEFVDVLKNLNPDLIIVVAYGKILPEKVLKLPNLKSLNVHASLLPKLRGPSPIQNSLLQGDTLTGVTIILMDEGIDTGNILSQKKEKIKRNDDYITLAGRLSVVGSKLLVDTIEKWADKKIKPKKQSDKEATLCQLIEKNDGRIFWDKSATEIYNAFRAFRSWPGIFTFWDNDGTIKKITLTLISASLGEERGNHSLGEVFKKKNKELCVQTRDGIIIINKLQMEGKNEVESGDFINGYPNFIGSILK